jgi:hypothetical protein
MMENLAGEKRVDFDIKCRAWRCGSQSFRASARTRARDDEERLRERAIGARVSDETKRAMSDSRA